MRKDEYSAGIMSESFWFQEFKTIVNLVQEGKTEAEIKDLCVKHNLLGAAKESRASRMYGYLIRRVNSMDEQLREIFCSSDLANQKIINLITVLRNDKLFFEFVYEVYRDKVGIGAKSIEPMDMNVFFKHKEMQDENLSTWKDTTVTKVKRTYLTFMVEANLLAGVGQKNTITPPLLDITLERYLELNNEEAMLKAVTGVM